MQGVAYGGHMGMRCVLHQPRTHVLGVICGRKVCTALHAFATSRFIPAQAATACTAGSRQATCRAQQARSALAAVRETAGLAEAKVFDSGCMSAAT